MALRFSSGLLTGLQQYGQGGGAIPADPRQRDAMQAAGVTNPLLQQFGRGLGGMLGTEMRSPAAIQQAEQRAQQEQLKSSVGAIKDPSSYEGMVQLAQAVMKIDPIQGAQLLAKAEEMKKASQMSQLEAGNLDIQEGLQGTKNQALARTLQSKGFDGLATQVLGGDEEARKNGIRIISESASGSSSASGVKAGTWKDNKGNFYIATRVLDKSTGQTTLEYNPVGNAPAYSNQNLTLVNAEGLTASEDVALSVSGAANKKFSELRLNAVDNIGSLQNERETLDSAIALAETVQTGGPLNVAGTSIERFLGEIPADKAEFELLLGNAMYAQLKPLFGGVISDTERKAIEKIYAGLEKGNAANIAILKRLKEETDKAYRKARLALSADTYEDYLSQAKKFYPDTPTEQKNTVRWDDL